jgi:hypothetical protein
MADLPMLAAVRTTPSFTTVGKPQPTGPSQPDPRTTSTAVATMAWGGRLGRLDPYPLGEKLTRLSVDGRAFDPRPTDVVPNTFMRPPASDNPTPF